MKTDINELENKRKDIKNKYTFGYTLSFIISIGSIFLTKKIYFCFIFLIIGIVITSISQATKLRNYILEFKNLFVLKSLEKIFTNLTYYPEQGLEKQDISSTHMMDMGDIYHSNDYIKGTYKNINFKQADVHIKEEYETTDADGNTETHERTIFMGRWMIFDFNKSFKVNTAVISKGFYGALLGRGDKNGPYQKITLEDEVFNKTFRTYSQNAHEAFYILSPQLMDKMLNIFKSTNSPILFGFVDNKLHIGLNNSKDSFEPSIWKKIDEEKIIESISQDIKLITSFIDDLDLDNDLFKKEI